MKMQFKATLYVAVACATLLVSHAGIAATTFTETDRQQIKEVFERQAQAATAHDLAAFDAVFAAPSEVGDPVVFVARPYQFWGKSELIDHFRETFKGVWKFEPDLTKMRVIPLTPDVAQLYAPTQITLGHSAADARTASYLVYEVVVRTPAGWRIGAIVPIAAQ
ncbi:YybH family protein [Herbaspirillum rhizosphaerae]|uniref:YybH family protein n=1 Tax=Herbaspirillum rhizosphaerae TaxID=346179 RepID=UPI000A4830DE|nr:nuclear transport factor 2 family protein [Herbaspirillum rhizosphaerae]